MKIWFIILIFLTSFLLSCGFNKATSSHQQTGYIKNLRIQNNQLTFSTPDSTFVYLSYQDKAQTTDFYQAWSAGHPKTNHIYSLPVKQAGVTYQIDLKVTNIEKTSYKDTTFVFTATTHQDDFLKVHFINVQQGDAILIETPEGKNIQIDGGYGTLRNQTWQGSGQPLALNYIHSQNITHFDYLIETHRHEDHWGGLQDIMNSDISYDIYLSPSDRHGYEVGSTLSLDSAVKFHIYNIGYDSTYTENNLNNSSIVLKAIYDDAEFLFTGDAEGIVQEWLYQRDFDLSVDVLKVPHHGADSNNTTDSIFLQKTLNQFAKIAILSFGENNRYRHPRDLNRFSQHNVFGTNPVPNPPTGDNFHFDCGTIIVITDGKLIYVTTDKDR